jgi:hypothetical protein
MKTNLFILAGALTLSACSSSVETTEGEQTVEATKIEKFVEPVAEFMSSGSGVQLFSYFDSKFKEETATIEGTFESTGAMGSNPVIFMKAFTVKDKLFAPYVLVSEEDKNKVKEALAKREKEGKPEELKVIFEGTFVKEGSDESPFSGEIRLRFANGKVISIE